MKLAQLFRLSLPLAALTLAFALLPSTARANVYATDIKLDGGTTNVVASAGDSVTISYILNEPASRGVTINILSGAAVARSLVIAAKQPGTQTGLNTVTWDGKDGNGNPVSGGTYSVSITAASSGYTNWTQITTDDSSTYVWEPRGIAVDRNPASLYYGRIFVANAFGGPGNLPGDVVGILKLNADASPADEGENSAGTDGHNWSGNHLSPWKLTISADDYVYVDDLANGGEVFRWDPTLSSNSLVQVLTTNNQPPGATLNALRVVGTGTNAELWMADSTGTNGIIKWALTNTDATCGTNDVGETVIPLGTNLTVGAQALDLDMAGSIFTCQSVFQDPNPLDRVFLFSPTNPLAPLWSEGSNDSTQEGASGIAVDPTGTYVAVAFEGLYTGTTNDSGNTRILNAKNGKLVANLDFGVFTDPTSPEAEHDDTDCAWDAVGNIYYLDNLFGFWIAFSPPGANQSTTLAVMQIQVQGSSSGTPPTVTGISITNNTVTILFFGVTGDVPSNFLVLGAANALGPFSTLGAATITQFGPGNFSATIPVSGPAQFFEIQRSSSTSSLPVITNISVANGVVTLVFSGSSSDVASNFSLEGASSPLGPFSVLSNATVTQVSSGVFSATVPVSGPVQFYRVRK